MQITFNPRKVKAMIDAIKDTSFKLKKEFAIVLNKTAKAGERIIAKEVSKELNTSIKAIADTIHQRGTATIESLSSSVNVAKTNRIPLKRFGARQTRAGTSYKISKTRGRKVAKSAFIAIGGHVFRRRGKSRLPIFKLYGPSPWGVAVVGNKIEPSKDQITRELTKQMNRRVDYILKKKTGVI
jgi:hypothetical protein